MITFLSFANIKYYPALRRIEKEAIESAFFDDVRIFTEKDLSQEIKDYCDSNRRGYGYWLWKPYIVCKAMEEMNSEDILVYSDAGFTINKNGAKRFEEYIDIVKNGEHGILSFQLSHTEKKYTKGDIFEYFDAFDLSETRQLVGGLFILRKTDYTSELIRAWFDTCNRMRNLIDDSESIVENDKDFIENRHDQSIFSIIRKKRGTHILPDESFSGLKYPRDAYPFWLTKINS